MKLVRNTLLCFLVAVSLLQAKDFMGLPIEDPVMLQTRPLPTWIMGGGGFLSYYLNSVDGGLMASVDRRFMTHHSLGVSSHLFFGGDLWDVGLDYRFYFLGSLMSGHDDFLRLSFSGMYLNKNDESFFSPMPSLGYGRDILFFENSNLVGRVEIRGAYLLGEPVEKKGAFVGRVGRFIVYLDFSILFF